MASFAKGTVWINRALPALSGNVDPEYRMDCFARYMLKNWKRDQIESWLAKNATRSADMRTRLNNQKGKRP